MVDVCYCEDSVMATCVASSKNEQRSCSFYEKARFEERCTHLYKECDNHCRSLEAVDFSKIHGVVKPTEAEIEVEQLQADLVDAVKVAKGEPVGDRRPCTDCLNFTGCPLMAVECITRGKTISTLVSSDYWDIGSNCSHFTSNSTGVSI